MSTKNRRKWLIALLLALLLLSLACQLVSGEPATPTPKWTDEFLPDPTQPPTLTSAPVEQAASGWVEIAQWAARASASSQYGEILWSASQAVGPPNTNGCGDNDSAWATAYAGESAWLLLHYDTPVRPAMVRIYQTYTPSSVVGVQLIEPKGQEHVIYTATPQAQACPYLLEIPVEDADYLVQAVRVVIDQSVLENWNEIDAVQLIGRVQPAANPGATPIATDEVKPPKPTATTPGDIPLPSVTKESPPIIEPIAKVSPPPDVPIMPFDPDRWFFDTFDESSGLPENKILSLAVDWDGVLWVATDSQGISSFSGGKWTRYTDQDGPQMSFARLIKLAPDGALWFAGNGVTRYDGKTVRKYFPRDGLVTNTVQDIAFAPDGSVWFAGIGGVSRFDGQNWINYTVENGLPSKNVNTIAVTPDGEVWIGTWDGAARRGGASWTLYTADDGLGHNMIHSITVGPGGALWFGTGGQGVARFMDEEFTSFRSDDGMAAYFVRYVVFAPDGALWVGAENSGAYRFLDGEWLFFGVEDGMAGPYVDDIAISREGIVYFGTRRSGLSRLAPQ